MDTVVIILFISFWLGIFLTIVFSITASQKKKAKLIKLHLKEEKLSHYKVQFLQMKTSKYTAIGGVWIKVDFYFNENLILIAPDSDSFFNGMNNFNLPIIITNNHELYHNKTFSSKIKKATEINYPWTKTMKIKYREIGMIDNKYDIQIRFNQKADMEKFRLINKV